MWEYAGVIGEKGARVLADGNKMPGARWFPDGKLNFAENLLRTRRGDGKPVDDAPTRSSSGARTRCDSGSRSRELRDAVSRMRRRSRPRAWGRATASPPSCPTCPRR